MFPTTAIPTILPWFVRMLLRIQQNFQFKFYICRHRNFDITQVHCFHLKTDTLFHIFVTKQPSSAVSFLDLIQSYTRGILFCIGAATHSARMGYSDSFIQFYSKDWETHLKSTKDWIVFTCESFLLFSSEAYFERLELSYYSVHIQVRVITNVLLVLWQILSATFLYIVISF